MTERLPDDLVDVLARLPATARQGHLLHAVTALAAEVQCCRARRCETCALWAGERLSQMGVPNRAGCPVAGATNPRFGCTDWETGNLLSVPDAHLNSK